MRSCLIAVLALCASGVRAENTSAAAVDAATFRALCGSCHSTALVEGLRTEEEWREEVDQMIKVGARGTEEQFQRVMRVLMRTLGRVNVNTATAPQIAAVLDLTDSAAEALVKRRAAAGKFKTLEDLKRVSGVDPARLEARKDRVIF
jgi:competence protein ComEA